MKTTLRIASLCLCSFAFPAAHAAAPASAATAPTAQSDLVQRADENRSRRLLEKAVAHYREKGEAALADFNRSPAFSDKELYVYVLTLDGEMLASGGPSVALVGRNVATMKDVSGKEFFRDMLDTAAKTGRGRIEYRWLNRLDNRVEPKVTLFERVDDRIIAVGYYTPRATAEQAKGLLERAVTALNEKGDAALDAFNAVDGGFIQDDLYVFVIDIPTRRFVAHGGSPAMVGTDGSALRDPKGKAVVTDMLNIVGRKGEGELDYAWRNPLTEKLESKHSFFRKVGDKIVGVGYYTR